MPFALVAFFGPIRAFHILGESCVEAGSALRILKMSRVGSSARCFIRGGAVLSLLSLLVSLLEPSLYNLFNKRYADPVGLEFSNRLLSRTDARFV